jgi:DNA-binding NtrC family response regulator
MGKLDDVIKIMSKIPNGISADQVEACYLIAMLHRHDGNRTDTGKAIKVCRRTILQRIARYEIEGYIVPEPRPMGRPKKGKTK